MNKSVKIILLIIVLILIAVGLYWWTTTSSQTENKISTVVSNLFPAAQEEGAKIVNSFFGGSSTSTAAESQAIGLSNKLTQITAKPISGAFFIDNSASSSVRYLDRETGYVYDYNLSLGLINQLTNTTKPGVIETFWGDNKVILRYLDGGQQINYLATLNHGTSSQNIGTLSGKELNQTISAFAVSPDKKSYFYLIPTSTGTDGYIGAFSSTANDSKVFSSPFPDWQVSWPNKNLIVLTSAPSFNLNGLAYSLNPTTKKTAIIIREIKGLTTLASPDGKKIVYNDASDGGLRLISLQGSNSSPLSLGVFVLPEKCVWNQDSTSLYCFIPNTKITQNLPDSWYQGSISFTDSLWSIDASTGSTQQLFNPETSSQAVKIDGINLFFGGKNKLFFTNKKDGTLWLYNFNTQLPVASSTGN